MDTTSFVEYLNKGPSSIVSLCILIFIITGCIYLILNLIFNKGHFKFKNIEVGGNNTKEKDLNPMMPSDKHNKKSTIGGSNVSITASQDYKIIYLILQAHAERVSREMELYCKKNGLNEKSKEDYDVYVDEKKNLYIHELNEMLNREYVSYDIIDIHDVRSIINELKEEIMNKVEKLYQSLRNISIEEHKTVKAKRADIYLNCLNNITFWKKINYTSDTENGTELEKIVNVFKTEFEKVVIYERIDILERQKQKIDVAKKDLTDLILNRVIDVIHKKYESINK